MGKACRKEPLPPWRPASRYSQKLVLAARAHVAEVETGRKDWPRDRLCVIRWTQEPFPVQDFTESFRKTDSFSSVTEDKTRNSDCLSFQLMATMAALWDTRACWEQARTQPGRRAEKSLLKSSLSPLFEITVKQILVPGTQCSAGPCTSWPKAAERAAVPRDGRAGAPSGVEYLCFPRFHTTPAEGTNSTRTAATGCTADPKGRWQSALGRKALLKRNKVNQSSHFLI